MDHLLSKEHWPPESPRVVQSRAHTVIGAHLRVPAGVWGGARGWNADQFGRLFWLPLVRPAQAGGERGWSGVSAVVGTLLGPEGADPPGEPGGELLLRFGADLLSYRRCPRGGGWAGGGVGSGTGRTLRTAQWTRASSDSVAGVCVGPHRSFPSGGGCAVFLCGQVVKGTRWMPGHQEPMKDVGGCDKPRGAVNRALIRGFPNGGTPHQSCGVTRA